MKSTQPAQPQYTREEHDQLAQSLLIILDEVAKITQINMTKPPGVRRKARTTDQMLRLGRHACLLQMALEQDLSRQDGTDLHSWDLYYPQDRPSARIQYAVR